MSIMRAVEGKSYPRPRPISKSSSAGVDWAAFGRCTATQISIGLDVSCQDWKSATVWVKETVLAQGASCESGPGSSQDGLGGLERLHLETCLILHLRKQKDTLYTHLCCAHTTQACVHLLLTVSCVCRVWRAAGWDTRCDPMQEFVETIMQ